MTIRTVVTTIDQAYDAINGKAYTLDGIHGHIKVEHFAGRLSISHNPSKKGKETDAYQKMRAQLRDDWSSDLTNSERLGTIMWELGIRFPDEK
jgi:hypothetical protein